MTDIKTVLPPLPKPWHTQYDDIGHEEVPCYSPTQMHAYAEAAVLAASAPAQEPVGEIGSRFKFGGSFSVLWKDGYWPKAGDKLYAAPVDTHDAVDGHKPTKACGNCKHGSHSPTDECETCFSDPQSMLNNKLQNWEPIAALQASQSPQDQAKEK